MSGNWRPRFAAVSEQDISTPFSDWAAPAGMQVVWGISILVSSPVLFLVLHGSPRGAHSELLLGAGCITSVFAELFMIKSLVVFDPEYRPWPARLRPKYSAKALSEAGDSVGQSDDDVEEETEPAPLTPRWQPRWVRQDGLDFS